MQTDEELIELANNGDPEAFETLYYRHKDWVYSLAWRYTNNQEQALDVLQETFIYLINKFPKLKLTARMTTFLYPVVKHISLIICRENKRRNNLYQLSEPAWKESKNINSSQEELAAVLAILPEGQKEIILMHFIDDMKIAEIAEALNIPVGTVKSRLHNGLQTLRNDRRTQNYFLE